MPICMPMHLRSPCPESNPDTAAGKDDSISPPAPELSLVESEGLSSQPDRDWDPDQGQGPKRKKKRARKKSKRSDLDKEEEQSIGGDDEKKKPLFPDFWNLLLVAGVWSPITLEGAVAGICLLL
ncbi:hypothetical protein CRG98_028619 [Punica granatum]|uniref:Uncharacterized protein n=1 Tax=Punica granatum TaxID=22663 RepID=A0A2I0J447_PUNGR|nr:hypothetical protein CRG98_028619 [Punica granatum]